MGVITPFSEQLTKPLPYTTVLVTLKELSSGAHKLLPEGTRLVVSVHGNESQEELEILKGVDAMMILHNLQYAEKKISRVHATRRLFEHLSENFLSFPNIHHIEFPSKIHRDDLVIGAETKSMQEAYQSMGLEMASYWKPLIRTLSSLEIHLSFCYKVVECEIQRRSTSHADPIEGLYLTFKRSMHK